MVGWVLAGLLAAGVLITALVLEPDDRIEAGSEVLAWEACRGEVLGRLREPDTAVFPPASEAVFRDEDPRWTVRAYVDADNSFGQVAREGWVCTIRFGASGARLIELQLTAIELDGSASRG